MTSLFPQFGNVFGNNSPAGRNELVSFNAGKMTVKPTANGKFLITPDLKKGKICLSRGDDQLLHFQWMDRQSGTSPEDFIIFPDDALFSKVDTGREGDRVFLLQYKNSSRRFFFWMQNKDSSRDDELVKKVNDCMNNVQQSTSGNDGGRGAGAGNVQLDHNAIMQMLGAMGAGEQGRGGAGGQTSVQMSELQNILQNMGLPASQSAVSSPATSAVSSSQASQSGGNSSVAATTASTTHDHDMGGDEEEDDDDDDDDEMTEEEMLRLAIEESMRDVNEDQEREREYERHLAQTARIALCSPALALALDRHGVAAFKRLLSSSFMEPKFPFASSSHHLVVFLSLSQFANVAPPIVAPVAASAPSVAAAPAPSAPPTAPALSLISPSATAPGVAPAGITAADLQRAMASIQSLAAPKLIKLSKLLSAENVASLLDDENAVQALIAHLPEGAQNAYELQATLHSPQLRQSISSLVQALQTGNYNAVLTNFGLDPAAGAAKLAYGDVVGAFLAAIQHWADQQQANMDSAASSSTN
ncbi:Proteasomal ubiquitin receptor adrm1-like protein, partial [Globisporangium splendens]